MIFIVFFENSENKNNHKNKAKIVILLTFRHVTSPRFLPARHFQMWELHLNSRSTHACCFQLELCILLYNGGKFNGMEHLSDSLTWISLKGLQSVSNILPRHLRILKLMTRFLMWGLAVYEKKINIILRFFLWFTSFLYR